MLRCLTAQPEQRGLKGERGNSRDRGVGRVPTCPIHAPNGTGQFGFAGQFRHRSLVLPAEHLPNPAAVGGKPRTSEHPNIGTSEHPNIRTSEHRNIRTSEYPNIRISEHPCPAEGTAPTPAQQQIWEGKHPRAGQRGRSSLLVSVQLRSRVFSQVLISKFPLQIPHKRLKRRTAGI